MVDFSLISYKRGAAVEVLRREPAMMDFLNPVDVHVGARVRATRIFRTFELWELGSTARIPTSLLLQYEAGTTRCQPEHLAAIADALNVRSTLFFDGLRKKATKANFANLNQMPETAPAANDNSAGTGRKFSL